jgi:mRNA-degrading endonuclease RelE of RelBE toxin-antitoxin system
MEAFPGMGIQSIDLWQKAHAMSQLASRVDWHSVIDVQCQCLPLSKRRVVRGSGGVRKARWRQPGRGKRGGVRIIYYVKTRDAAIWLLTIYAKNEQENIASETLRKIKDEIDG